MLIGFLNQKRIPDPSSEEYAQFFEFHKDLCQNGAIVNGVYINPFLYWHLNFWNTEVDTIDERGRINQKYANPFLRDNEWVITNEIDRAQNEKKGLVILGIRRLAKSVIESSYVSWGATFDENSQNIIAGLNAPDIKLITDKIDKGLNFLPEAWRWQRIEDNWKNQVTLGIKTKAGERIPFSQILIRNLDEGNNEEAIAGTKPRKLIIDEIGKGSFLRGLQAATPGFTTPYGWGCSPILTGTGGDMKRFMDAKSLMFDVQNFNFLEYKNEKDESRVHGLFIGHKYRMEAKEESTLGAFLDQPKDSPLHDVKMLVSNQEKADEITNGNLARLKKAGDRIAYLKEKMYYPQEVDDIFLNEDTNIFDIESAKRQKNRLLQQERTGTSVVLYDDGDGIKHEFTDKLPISNFPLKNSDQKDAPVVIYEFPIDAPPYGLYVAGVDPYRQGKSAYSSSLGSVYIYKRMHAITGEKYQDMFVASYCARPDKKEVWEEQARLLIKYYNARALCENDEISFIDYMISKNDSHYLERQPDWLKEIVPNTTVRRDFGIHRSSEKIRDFLHGCLKKYTEEVLVRDLKDDGELISETKGMVKIFDPMLLEEMIQYNEDGNFDRIIAAELAIAMAMKLDPIIGRTGAKEDGRVTAMFRPNKKNTLFTESRGMFNNKKRKLFYIMAIIRYTKDATIRYAYLNIFPDQFKTEEEKQDESWIKNTMDYFSNKAYAEYVKNRDTFVKNYDLVKGILRSEDFYQEPDIKSYTDMLTADLALPAYVKHYSILTTPINELVGEITKRPDKFRVKAFDDDSKAEELEFKTGILQEYILQEAKKKILEKAALEGAEIDDEQLQQMTMDEVKDELDSYTSIAEKWGNHVLTCQKAEFVLKEKSEDAFRDLLISAREFYHIYEDNSKTGFNVEVANPKNTWFLTTPDRKFVSDPTGREQASYAAGTVNVMELSEIIETFPDLTKEEIDHLRSSLQDYGLINVRESNLGNPDAANGIDSVQYDTFDPLVLQTRMMIEGEMKENNDGLKDFLGLTSNVSSFGYKYVVVRAYWASKKKIGKLIYIDELGNEQSILVDETYKSNTIPTQQSLEWGWINQWYQGTKIGPDIYHIKPYKLLNYCPIIGIVHEIKNTEAKSLVDMMKPFQVIYNVCMNQLYKLLEKEVGKVQLMSLRHIPIPKDGDAQDALDIWKMEARNRGVVFIDDSPENLKAPSSFNQFTALDLTRTQEIQSRYTIAQQIKAECWELIGMSRQRMGSVSASESATGTNTAIQQSYSQTEPLFVAHEYVLGQLYQAIIDAALYVESSKPQSTLSYVTNEGESAFVQVNGSDLKLRELKVFLTNRPEDTKMFEELRQLAQPLMQNGGSLYDVIELYSSNSTRQLKKIFKDLRDKQDALQQQQIQQQQQQTEQQGQIAQAQMQQAAQQQEQQMAHDDYQRELDRLSKEKIAIIQATGFGNVPSEDVNQNAVPDVLEMSKLSQEQEKATQDYSLRMADMQSKNKQFNDKLGVERDKIAVARENMANDLAVAKENAKGRSTKKS